MSDTSAPALRTFSHEIESIVQSATSGIVAIKALAHRVSSGVIVGPDLIAAADHAVKREDKIPVFTSTGQELHGRLLGRIPSLDLAIIKTEQSSLTPLPAAEPDSVKPGGLAVVVGLTLDVGPSVSLGVLGAVGDRRRTWRGGILDQFIRLDVNLYPSQTGSAVVDVQGRLIGLATPALLRHSALAIPVPTLQRFAQELSREGRVRHGYLGIGVQPVAIPSTLQAKVGIQTQAGLIVMLVNPDSPADKAGMQLGDILVSLADRQMSNIDDLQDALLGPDVEKTVPATLIRGGELISLSVTIAERDQTGKSSESH